MIDSNRHLCATPAQTTDSYAQLMAGFDYEFAYTENQASLVDSALAAQRRRARALDLRIVTERKSPAQVYVQVNGNSRRMDVLGYRLERELPLVCEGNSSSGLPPRERRRLGLGVADMYLRGRNLGNESEKPMILRGVADTRYYFPVFEFSPQEAGTEQLQHRLRLTEELIADWDVRNISHFTVIEELHTASELLLQAVIPLPRRQDYYPQRLEAARDQKLLDESEIELLKILSRYRNGARHHAKDGFEVWLDANWEAVALVLERLCHKLRSPAPHGDNPETAALV